MRKEEGGGENLLKKESPSSLQRIRLSVAGVLTILCEVRPIVSQSPTPSANTTTATVPSHPNHPLSPSPTSQTEQPPPLSRPLAPISYLPPQTKKKETHSDNFCKNAVTLLTVALLGLLPPPPLEVNANEFAAAAGPAICEGKGREEGGVDPRLLVLILIGLARVYLLVGDGG